MAASGHGRINNFGDVAIQGSVWQTGLMTNVHSVTAPSGLSNLPSMATPVVGRDDELRKLDTVMAHPGRVAVLSGLGGIGKSTLALAHASRRSGTGPTWWMSANSPSALDAGLAALAVALQPALATALPMEAAAARAVQWLVEHEDWLLVLDDVTDAADVEPLLARLHGKGGGTIVTSRLAHGWHRFATMVIRLDALTPEAAVTLFAGMLESRSGNVHTAERAELRELAADLGCLPLALTMAGAYLIETGMTAAQYRYLLAERFNDFAEGSIRAESSAQTVAEVFGRALAAVAHVPQALPLLRVLSWYSHEAVPIALLQAADERSPGQTSSALGALSAHSLVHLTEDTVSVHRLVQTLVRTVDDRDPLRQPADIEAALASATRLLDQYAPAVHNPRGWSKWQSLLPHIIALADRSTPHSDTPVTAHLLNQTGLFLCEQGDPVGALSFLGRSHAGYQRTVGEADRATLAALGNLAGAYQMAGRIDEAVDLFHRALETGARFLGQEHPTTLAILAALAGALLARGGTASAVEMLERAMAAHEQTLGPDDEESLTVAGNLAYAYQVTGEPERAIPLLERILFRSIRLLGDEHPATLTSRHNLAGAHHAAGHLDSALPLLEQNLQHRIRVLGGDHPETLRSRNSLAYALLSAGDLTSALPMLERALADRERVLGPHNQDTITSRSNLAAAYREAGNLTDAVTLLERTLEDCLQGLGPGHPDVLAARQNLASTYRAAGRYPDALALFEVNRIEYERVLGPEHQDTLTARNNLAVAYWENGDLRRALPLLEHEVDDCARLLGDTHPNTLIARANLALALLRGGEPDRARQLLEATVADYERVLGPEHPVTLTAANNLAGAYDAVGDPLRALTLYEENLEKRRRVLGPHHPDVLASYSNLASAYEEAGRRDEAVALYRDTLRDCELVMGDAHPLTETVRRNLAALTRAG
ncbi:hypothetical protein KNE206_52700 [Kitasatospora sp. NE20-6]